MNIAIWGAGGIGCYYGARLQRAGHQVTYIARGEHLQALQNNGLSLSHESVQFAGPVTAISQQQWQQDHQCDDYDLIIICLKSTVTADVMRQMQPWLSAGQCPVLSLQNGVDNEVQIADIIGAERTLGGLAVRIGGHILEPGVVEARGVAQVVFGQWPNDSQHGNAEWLNKLLEVFTDAGVETRLSPDIQRELWRKLLINNGVNPLSALTGLDTRQVTSDPVLGPTVYRIMQETAQAAGADGVELTPDDVDEMFQLISQFDAIKTSMLVDLEKGRLLEREAISGAVIERCRKLGQPAQTTELVDTLLRVKCEKLGLI